MACVPLDEAGGWNAAAVAATAAAEAAAHKAQAAGEQGTRQPGLPRTRAPCRR